MKRWSIWHWGIFIFVLIVTAILVSGLAKAISDKGFGSGEAASWMQAIGSFGAIVGAIAVANHQIALQRAERQTDRRVRATVAASRLYMDIAYTIGILEPIHSWLESRLNAEPDLGTFDATLFRLQNLFNPDIQIIIDLEPLEQDAAYRLAAAISQLITSQQVAAQVRGTILHPLTPDQRISQVKSVEIGVRFCLRSLNVVLAECRKVSDAYAYA